MPIDRIGIGIQYNPEILSWFPFEEQQVDALEILLDTVMGPLDSPYVLRPGAAQLLERLAERHLLIAHSNYGCDFGFLPLDETPAVLRHVPIARALNSPWVSNHCFYGDASWVDIWSSPLQFSRAEAKRVARRAAALQERYGMPLCHENAAYYLRCPGGELREAEFLALLVETAGTNLHLDLHNIYTNAVNFPQFDLKNYLDTIPLERVVAIHLAGGSWHGGVYHDWHDSRVPEPVWDLLDEVLQRARPAAVILEFQGQAHHAGTRVLGSTADRDMIVSDIERARAAWDRAYGPGTRRTAAVLQP